MEGAGAFGMKLTSVISNGKIPNSRNPSSSASDAASSSSDASSIVALRFPVSSLSLRYFSVVNKEQKSEKMMWSNKKYHEEGESYLTRTAPTRVVNVLRPIPAFASCTKYSLETRS